MLDSQDENNNTFNQLRKHRNSGILNRLRLRKSSSSSSLDQDTSSVNCVSSSKVGTGTHVGGSNQNIINTAAPAPAPAPVSGGLKRFMKGGSKYKTLENFESGGIIVETNKGGIHGSPKRGKKKGNSEKSSPKKNIQVSPKSIRVVNHNHNKVEILQKSAIESSPKQSGAGHSQPQKTVNVLSPIQLVAEPFHPILDTTSSPKPSVSRQIPEKNVRQRSKDGKENGIKKKRKSFKVTDKCRLLDDPEDVDTDTSSTSEGSVQKKLREVEMHSVSEDTLSFPHNSKVDTPKEGFLQLTENGDVNNTRPLFASPTSLPPVSLLQITSSSSDELDSPNALNNCPFDSMYYDGDGDDDCVYGYSDDEEEDVDDDDDDESCDSTVVNDLPPRSTRPPPSATKEEQMQFYWKQCYGKEDILATEDSILDSSAPTGAQGSWSANRAPPPKSCLSAKKTPWSEIALSASKRDRRQHFSTPASRIKIENKPFAIEDDEAFSEPPKIHRFSNYEVGNKMVADIKSVVPGTPVAGTPANATSMKRNVQFGAPSAAEFDLERPVGELTPLPSAFAEERFPVDEKVGESDEESEEMHVETRRNAAMLAMWDADFDSYIGKENEDDESLSDHENDNEHPATSETSRKTKLLRFGRKVNGNFSNKRNRRSSTFFSKDGGSLLNCDQEQNRNEGTNENKRDSLAPETQSSLYFSSPSSNNSSSRNSTDASSSSKETPKTDRTSSSSLLRSVHSSGGATLGHEISVVDDDINTHPLKPSLLDSVLQTAEDSTCSENSFLTSSESSISQYVNDQTKNDWEFKDLLRTAVDKDYVTAHHHEITRALDDFLSTQKKEIIENNYWERQNPSFLNLVFDMDTLLLSGRTSSCGRLELGEVFQMIISVLEQQLQAGNSPETSHERLSSFAEVHQCMEAVDLRLLYDNLSQSSIHQWQKMEIQALSMALSWLQPLKEENNLEKETLDRHLEKSTYTQEVKDLVEDNKYIISRARQKMVDEKIIEELQIIEALENEVKEKSESLNFLKCQDLHWSKKLEVIKVASCHIVDCLTLSNILHFEARTLSFDAIDIFFHHLDRTQTILSWKNSRLDEKQHERDSVETQDSLFSANSVVEIVTQTPEIKRITDGTFISGNVIPHLRQREYLPNYKTTARELYHGLLNRNNMNQFILNRFRYEPEMGFMTVADILQRLDLVAKDVIELQRYYSCEVEFPPKMDTAILHVKISYDHSSIRIRFAYDYSNQKSMLHCIPSDVFIESLAGEPSVPLNILLKVAKENINSYPICNAFILKRTCALIVEILQGRQL